MTKLKTKLMTIFVSLLVLSLSITLPVSAAMPDGTEATCGCGSTCGTCDSGCGGECSLGNVTVNVTELEGSEKNKAVANALKNSEVKALKKELLDRGYTPKVNGAIVASKVTVTNGNITEEAITVEISFNTHGADANSSIVWIKTSEEEKVVAVVRSNANYLTEPMDILKGNNTYQEIVENLTAQGYVIDEENAIVTEVITKDSNLASVKIKATNPANESDWEYIVGIVDLESGNVISVRDYGKCDLCKDIYGLACNIGCGADMALICLLLGVTGWGAIACFVIGGAVCYFIGTYGCAPGAVACCRDLGYC